MWMKSVRNENTLLKCIWIKVDVASVQFTEIFLINLMIWITSIKYVIHTKCGSPESVLETTALIYLYFFFVANYFFSASKIQRVMEISNLVRWLQTPPLLNHTYTHVLVANLTSYFILFWISPKSSVNKNSPTMATVSGFEHCQETHRLKHAM